MLFDAGLSSSLTAAGTDKRVFIPLRITGWRRQRWSGGLAACLTQKSGHRVVDDIDGFSRDRRQILRTRIDEFVTFGHNL